MHAMSHCRHCMRALTVYHFLATRIIIREGPMRGWASAGSAALLITSGQWLWTTITARPRARGSPRACSLCSSISRARSTWPTFSLRRRPRPSLSSSCKPTTPTSREHMCACLPRAPGCHGACAFWQCPEDGSSGQEGVSRRAPGVVHRDWVTDT